jgi:hypothetical protein
MRIAFCLSGAPRFKHQGLFRLVKFLKGFDHADFFIRTWKTDQFGNTGTEFINYLKSNGIPDNCHFPVVQMLDDVPENYPPHIPLNLAHWAPNFLILWWGVVQCNELRLEYERLTGVKYDLVFRMRTDMCPVHLEGGRAVIDDTLSLDLKDYVEAAQHKIYNAKNFADNFLFGSPELYNKYVNYWDHLQVLSERQTFVHPEESLEAYFKEADIPYDLIPYEIYPTHDRDEYKVRPF